MGSILHACAFDDTGDLHVADVWESVEAMNAFVNDRLLPAMQKLNVPPPSVSVYTAFNINAYPSIQPFILS